MLGATVIPGYREAARFIADFEKHCVDFLNNAVDPEGSMGIALDCQPGCKMISSSHPADPEKWQENALATTWGQHGCSESIWALLAFAKPSD